MVSMATFNWTLPCSLPIIMIIVWLLSRYLKKTWLISNITGHCLIASISSAIRDHGDVFADSEKLAEMRKERNRAKLRGAWSMSPTASRLPAQIQRMTDDYTKYLRSFHIQNKFYAFRAIGSWRMK